MYMNKIFKEGRDNKNGCFMDWKEIYEDNIKAREEE